MNNLGFSLDGGSCPICLSARLVTAGAGVSRYLRIAPHQKLTRCKACRHLWKSPFVGSDKELTRTVAANNPDLTYGEYAGAATEAAVLPTYLRDRIQDKVTEPLIDFGSGEGSFVAGCRNSGLVAYGVDSGPPSTQDENARDFVYKSLADLPRRDFRTAHANHVIEHVEDPVGILQELRSILVVGGKVLIEVPNEIVSLSALAGRLRRQRTLSATSVFEHEHFFSRRSMRAALERANFRDASVSTKARTTKRHAQFIYGVANQFNMGEVIWAEAVR